MQKQTHLPSAQQAKQNAERLTNAEQLRADVSAATAEAPVVLVASEDRARGLDIAGVEAVLILGGPANADTFVHLSGRVDRDPLSLGSGPEPSVVTIGRKRDVDQVRGWLSELGEEISEL